MATLSISVHRRSVSVNRLSTSVATLSIDVPRLSVSVNSFCLFDLVLYVHSTIFQLCGTVLPGFNKTKLG